MKKILLLILVALVTYSSSFAIGGFKVVIKKPGAAVPVQVRIVDYAPTGPTTLYTGPLTVLTPNASGIIVASVPQTDGIIDPVNIPAVDVTSYYIVEVWTGSPLALSSQQRLDEMIFEQAQTGLTDNEGNVTLEPGKELIFPEPAGSGENFTSFKSPALAADVEYTLPDNAGSPNQYLKINAGGIMSWDNPTVSTNTTIDGNGLTGSPLGLADNAVTTAKINNDAVTTGKIVTGAVTTDKIGSSAVTDVKIGSSAVTTAKINNAAVTTDKIANSAVTTDKIGSSAVTDVKIGSSAVTTAKINDGAVTEAKLADDAVATAKIEDKAVTAAKISPGATNGHVLTVSGTDAVWAAPAGGGGGGSGKVLVDANNVTLGTIVGFSNRASVTVITSGGYVVDITLELVNGFPFDSDQIWWTGASCTGSPYLNDGGSSGQKRNSNYLVYSGSNTTLYTLANPSANGVSTSVAIPGGTQSIENSGSCSSSTGGTSGWALTATTNAAVGLPTTIAYPLAIQ